MSKRIPLSEPFFFGKEKDYVLDAIESTWISGSGKYLEKFEGSISFLIHLINKFNSLFKSFSCIF